jgi:hypothetical protein
MTQRRMLANALLRVRLVTTVRDPESPATQSDLKTVVGDATFAIRSRVGVWISPPC